MNRDVTSGMPSTTDRISPGRLSLSAGLGSSFALLIALGLVEIYGKTPHQAFYELIAIFIVTTGIVVFVDPLLNQVRHVFGLAEDDHFIVRSPKWWLQLGGFVVIAGASISHGALHEIVKEILSPEKLRRALFIAFGAVIAGLITRAWVSKVQQGRSAAWTGGAVGATLGGALALTIYFIKIPSLSEEQRKVLALASACQWGGCGLVGGLALDRRWGSRAFDGILGAFLGVAAVVSVPVLLIVDVRHAFLYLARALGWAAGLWALGPAAEALLRPRPA